MVTDPEESKEEGEDAVATRLCPKREKGRLEKREASPKKRTSHRDLEGSKREKVMRG